jgi:hypothetical protein
MWIFARVTRVLQRVRGYCGGIWDFLMEFMECMAFFECNREKKSADLRLFKGVFDAFLTFCNIFWIGSIF